MDLRGHGGVEVGDERALMEATEVRGGRVLVVDDDPDVREAVETALELEGHRVATAADGLAALKRLGQVEFDAVVLDVLMPNLDGFEVCRRLRASGNRTPVLILTARDSEEDTIRGLDLGADDYLVKPFALGELLARVRALLRRTRPAGEDAPLWFAGLSLDRQTREASRGGRTFELTRTEYALLELFMRNPRQVLTRELIMERVWNYDFGPTSNPLEVYISYLRRKTEAGGEPRLIHTVRGVGYAAARAVSLRTRLTLAGGGAVFVALAIASLVIYVEVRSKLHDQIDVSLIQSAETSAAKWQSNALAFGKGAPASAQKASRPRSRKDMSGFVAGQPR